MQLLALNILLLAAASIVSSQDDGNVNLPHENPCLVIRDTPCSNPHGDVFMGHCCLDGLFVYCPQGENSTWTVDSCETNVECIQIAYATMKCDD